MKLVVIYGPPAVGKLSVSNALAKLTGFKIFHNHLTLNCITSIFEFGSPPFSRLLDKIRIEIITEAAKENIPGLIYTFCYANIPQDRQHIMQVIATVRKYAGTISLVQLFCALPTLKERVVESSRQLYGKISTVVALEEFLQHYDLFSPIPQQESLFVDNTHLSSEQTAAKIVTHYQLSSDLGAGCDAN